MLSPDTSLTFITECEQIKVSFLLKELAAFYVDKVTISSLTALVEHCYIHVECRSLTQTVAGI